MTASKSKLIPLLLVLCLLMLGVGGLAYFLLSPEESKGDEKNYAVRKVQKKDKTVSIDGGPEAERIETVKLGPGGKVTRVIQGPKKSKNAVVVKPGAKGVKRTLAFRGFPKQELPKVPEAIMKKTGLRGRLLDSSKNPVANAKVTAAGSVRGRGSMMIMGDIPGMPRGNLAGGPSATTDAEGRFVLMGLNYKLGYTLSFDGGEEYRKTRKPAPTLRAEEVVNAGDFTIQKPGSISGYVVDPSGQPVPGARVRIRDAASEMPIIFGDDDEEDEGEGKEKNVAVMVAKSSDSGEVTVFSSAVSGKKTDKDGRFTFEDLEPGKYTVTASKRGFRKAQVASIVVEESQEVKNVRLPLGVAGKMRVLVKNEAGEPVVGARVQAKPYNGMFVGGMFVGQQKSGVQTDNNGYAFLENLSQNKYRVVASAEGYADSSSIVEFKPDQEEVSATVTMKEGTRILGRLLNGKDRKPVSNAIVFVRSMNKEKARGRGPIMVPTMIQSDKEGRFQSKALNPGTYQVNVSADGLQSLVKTVTVSLDRKTEDLGDLVLEPLQSLEVTVLDREGKPLAGARVRVNQQSQGMRISRSSSKSEDGEEEDVDIAIGGMDSEKTTNEQGVVVLKSVAPGKVSLHVTKDGEPDAFAEDVLVNEGAGLSRATVRLMEPGQIEGRVTLGTGAPGSSLTVFLFRKGHQWPIASVKSDADGNYIFSKVCPGPYLLRVNSMRPASAGEKFIDLRSEETLREDLEAPAPKEPK